MIATQNSKVPFNIRKRPNFGVFNPGSKVANRNIVLRLAGNSAGVTPNALIMINYKTVLHATSVQIVAIAWVVFN